MSDVGGVTATLAWGGAAVVAFLVGAVNPATIVARLLGRDLASAGSGNPGATNAGRVLGPRWGVVVGVLDVLKGLLPTAVAWSLLGTGAAYLVGLAAVLGHVYSPYLRGRGGKGVATALGAVLGVHPALALVMVVVFGLVLGARRWVAGASLAAAGALVVLGVLSGLGLTTRLGTQGWWTTLWATALALIVVVRHRRNLEALRRARHTGS